MTSPYLIADETVRTMVKALETVPCDLLDSNRARFDAYKAAGVVLGNLALDQEAVKRQRIRRHQLGITVFALTVIASVQRAAAADMEAITGGLLDQARSGVIIAGIAFLTVSGFLTVFYLLRMLEAWLRIRNRERARMERDAADEIWS